MITSWMEQLELPQPASHKGQNGKVLIVGGSDLFHAASIWSFTVASRLVDMAFFASTVENNALIQHYKTVVRDGVVVPRAELGHYVTEANAVLLGPGMRRDFPTRFLPEQLEVLSLDELSPEDWEHDTTAIVAALLHAFPKACWVLDAGALQVLQAGWLPARTILTPHRSELERILAFSPKLAHQIPVVTKWQAQLRDRYWTKGESLPARVLEPKLPPALQTWFRNTSQVLHHATLILKGPVDIIWDERKVVAVVGGNAGLTKGGTGDVLAGLITGFASTSSAFPSVVVASYLNKQAGHDLYTQRGTMFNTSDVVEQLPFTWQHAYASVSSASALPPQEPTDVG